jgi:cell division septation protein DedD
MIPKDPTFTARPNIESPALQRRQQVVDAFTQDRILNAAARAAASQPQEPQLFPDLAANDAEAGPEIPPNPYRAGAAVNPTREEPRDGGSRGRRFLWIGVGAISAVAILLPLLMWLKHEQQPVVADADLPVVAAEPGAEKERPADEGGLQPPNQDVAVYDTLNGAAPTPQPKPETLLPPSETPMALPDPAPARLPPATGDGADASAIPAVPAPAFDVSEGRTSDVSGDAAAAANVEPSAGGNAADAAAPAAPTASEAPTDITTVVEQTAALGNAYRVQLAAVKSKDGAATTWTKLQKKHAKLLGNLELTVVEITKDGGKMYRVQAGPFADRATAVDTCVALKQVNQGCLVVNP